VTHRSILNFGKGTAVRIGLTLASGDAVLIQDGDLEYDSNDYRAILEPIVNGHADVVYGSRFLGKRTLTDISLSGPSMNHTIMARKRVAGNVHRI
jgi:glycosyltransferase involved in cell wall biosynthesis